MAGRARNLIHRSGVLVSVGGVTFAVAFGLLLWFTRTERAALQRVPAPADTVDLARKAASMRRLQFRADSILAEVSPPRRVTRRPVLVSDTGVAAVGVSDSTTRDPVSGADALPAVDVAADPVVATEVLPDSAKIAVAALSARLERAQNAPLAASWRALAADALLQQDERVRVLADSLADAERERNEYDAVGGVDPIYLELSSRVTGIRSRHRTHRTAAHCDAAAAVHTFRSRGARAARPDAGGTCTTLCRRFCAVRDGSRET